MSWWHWHAACAGEDNIAIGFLLGIGCLRGATAAGGMGCLVSTPIGWDCGSCAALMVAVAMVVVMVVGWCEPNFFAKD